LKRTFAAALFVAICLGTTNDHAAAADTSHLDFVTEYIRELAANERVREAASQELSTDATSNERLLKAIHGSTAIQLELRSQIGMLSGMHLNPPFDTLVPSIIAFYRQKIALHQYLIDISTVFVSSMTSGPKPDVDYGKMTAEVPKLRAQLDEVDHALFEATPLVFATLIDQRPDRQNHLSHLIVTRAQRDKLIGDLTTAFRQKMEQHEQNYTVSAASVLYGYLAKKGYKCADDPW
jgi:hypothetical protein